MMNFDELSEGITVNVDSGFSCMAAGEYIVRLDDSGFYLDCDQGKHHLSPDDTPDGTLVGIALKGSKDE